MIGFIYKRQASDAAELVYREWDGKHLGYEQVLDIKTGLDGLKNKAMLQVYAINPDYYFIFADLISDVLEFIQQWKTVSGGFVVDYQASRMGGL